MALYFFETCFINLEDQKIENRVSFGILHETLLKAYSSMIRTIEIDSNNSAKNILSMTEVRKNIQNSGYSIVCNTNDIHFWVIRRLSLIQTEAVKKEEYDSDNSN